MTTTVKNVQTFLDSVGFSNYADVEKITIKDEVVTVTIGNIHSDLAQAHESIAKKFGFDAVKVKSKDTTKYLVNVPEKGSFGFIKTYSEQHKFTFVIYNQKYAGNISDIKEIIPNFLDKIEETLAPHIQSIIESFTTDKENIRNEKTNKTVKNYSAAKEAISPFIKALKEKFIGLRGQKNDQPLGGITEAKKEEGSGVTFETDENGKLVIKKDGKVFGYQG